MSRETIRMLPAGFDEWPHIARHEAGHAVAYILGANDVYGNPYGIHSVHIRPGGTNYFLDRKGRPVYAAGLCETVGLHSSVGGGIAKHIKDKQPNMIAHTIRCAEWEIVGCLAGPYADMISHGHRSSQAIRWNAMLSGVGKSDFEMAFAVFEDLKILAGRRAGWVKLLDRTRRLVLENWHSIDLLAAALMTKKSMTHEDVMSTIGHLLPSRHAPTALAA